MGRGIRNQELASRRFRSHTMSPSVEDSVAHWSKFDLLIALTTLLGLREGQCSRKMFVVFPRRCNYELLNKSMSTPSRLE